MSKAPAKIDGTFVETTIDDETVIMHVDSADFYSLNATAGAIWQLIDGTRDRETIASTLADEYGASAEQIRGEVDSLLDDLGRAGFVTDD